MPTSTLTSKGQITIPRDIRERLRLEAGDRVDFEVSADGSVRMKPVEADIRQLKGCLKKRGRQPVTLEEMDQAIRQADEA